MPRFNSVPVSGRVNEMQSLVYLPFRRPYCNVHEAIERFPSLDVGVYRRKEPACPNLGGPVQECLSTRPLSLVHVYVSHGVLDLGVGSFGIIILSCK
jgi:hypothetical protein